MIGRLPAIGVAPFLAAVAVAQTPPALPEGPDIAPWQAAFPPRPATHGVAKRSLYIAMADGVRLAADVYLPSDNPPGGKLPAILVQTRYYRLTERKGDPGSCARTASIPAYFTTRGYAVVFVDVRGTGASFGTRSGELTDQEVIVDGGALLDWIVAQPWSSGRVGAMGQSYLGSAAELLPLAGRGALKAVAPISSTYDPYADLYFPGGILNTRFQAGWSRLNRALDGGRPDEIAQLANVAAPCPVDEDADGRLRAAAIAEHAGNFDSGRATSAVRFRDDEAFVWGFPAPYGRQAAIDRARVPLLAIEASMDSAYARSGVNRQINARSPHARLILTAGGHGAHAFYAPGTDAPVASAFDQNAEILAFFDRYVIGLANGYERQPRVRWFTTGADMWRGADAWPRPARTENLCLDTGHRLSAACGRPARETSRPSSDDLRTGEHGRWSTAVTSGPVFYAERSAVDATLTSYTSAPLPAALEVTGSPVVTLRLLDPDAVARDCFVLLEEVDAEGRSHIVGEGQLRVALRGGRAPYRGIAPMPSGRSRDARSGGKAGETIVRIGLIPFSHRFAAGSRLRLVIAGADSGNFAPGRPNAAWTLAVGHGGSSISLPVAAAQ